MANTLLQNFRFTNRSDFYTTSQGIGLISTFVIRTLAGNDTIIGRGVVFPGGVVVGEGISSSATIDMGLGNDTLTGSGSSGVRNGGSIVMGAGNDAITGSGREGLGIYNFGRISTGPGNDTVTARSVAGGGIFNQNTTGGIVTAIMDTADGNDSISGNASAGGSSFGISNDGRISMGAGNDSLVGTSSGANGSGLSNSGTILMGEGVNRISGNASGGGISDGIVNTSVGFDRARIITGAGPDSITGKGGRNGIFNLGGTISTASGDDTITGIGASATGFGISNGAGSTIDMGAGNDTLRGSNSSARAPAAGGIMNSGQITMGPGNDVVDALVGGFIDLLSGPGTTNLGSGNDLLKGFGSGTFIGGSGTDRIVFNEATYTITTSPSGFNITSSRTPPGLFTTMKVSEFERIGTNSLALVAGTCTINSAGVANY